LNLVIPTKNEKKCPKNQNTVAVKNTNILVNTDKGSMVEYSIGFGAFFMINPHK